MNDELLTKLLKSLEESNKRIIEDANEKQTQELKDYVKKEVSEIESKFKEELNKTSREFEEKYSKLQEKYEKLEKDLKKNNIIVFGLECPTENIAKFVIETLNNLLQIKLTISGINNAYTIGKQSQKKPIIIKLVSYLTKQHILKNCRNLKGTDISIGEDLSAKEQIQNKILRKHLQKARSNNLNAVIRNKKLIINGQVYTTQQLETEDTDNEEYNIESSVQQENIEETTKQINSTPTTTLSKATENFEGHTKEIPDNVFEIVKADVSKKYPNNTKPLNKFRTSARLNSIEKQNSTGSKEDIIPPKQIKQNKI